MNRNNWSQRGPSDANRTRGRKWMAIRKRTLERDNWQCVACSTDAKPVLATTVDHRLPISKSGTDDAANLQSLCDNCRRAKDIADGVRVARQRVEIGTDGWPVSTTP